MRLPGGCRENQQLFSGCGAITLLRTTGGTFCQDQHMDMVTLGKMPGNGTPATQYFVIRVGGNDQNTSNALSPDPSPTSGEGRFVSR